MWLLDRLAPEVNRASEGPTRLEASGVWRGTVASGGTVHCLAGTLWVTIDGDNVDYLLQSGQELTLKAGNIMISPLGGAATFRLHP